MYIKGNHILTPIALFSYCLLMLLIVFINTYNTLHIPIPITSSQIALQHHHFFHQQCLRNLQTLWSHFPDVQLPGHTVLPLACILHRKIGENWNIWKSQGISHLKCGNPLLHIVGRGKGKSLNLKIQCCVEDFLLCTSQDCPSLGPYLFLLQHCCYVQTPKCAAQDVHQQQIFTILDSHAKVLKTWSR